jgi:hypothetical protein
MPTMGRFRRTVPPVGPVEGGVALGEHPAVGRHQPVAAVVGSLGHADDGLVQHGAALRPVEAGAALGEDAAVRGDLVIARTRDGSGVGQGHGSTSIGFGGCVANAHAHMPGHAGDGIPLVTLITRRHRGLRDVVDGPRRAVPGQAFDRVGIVRVIDRVHPAAGHAGRRTEAVHREGDVTECGIGLGDRL